MVLAEVLSVAVVNIGFVTNEKIRMKSFHRQIHDLSCGWLIGKKYDTTPIYRACIKDYTMIKRIAMEYQIRMSLLFRYEP